MPVEPVEQPKDPAEEVPATGDNAGMTTAASAIALSTGLPSTLIPEAADLTDIVDIGSGHDNPSDPMGFGFDFETLHPSVRDEVRAEDVMAVLEINEAIRVRGRAAASSRIKDRDAARPVYGDHRERIWFLADQSYPLDERLRAVEPPRTLQPAKFAA